jgi:alanine racemase
MMVMVKAFSYGTGSFEIANILENAGVDYLAVAYADEGIELRRAGIRLPVMVMNTEEAGFENLVKYNLEPELYSFKITNAFISFLEVRNIKAYPVHIKLDTGMHRLGFEQGDIGSLATLLNDSVQIRVASIFSHLAASDEPGLDNFTKQQAASFVEMSHRLEEALGIKVIKHISNSSAIIRHPQFQFNMVRLGIGLYGVDSDQKIQKNLRDVATLRTTISQIRIVKAGESVGYNRAGLVNTDTSVATVRIGYADGYPRSLGNGKGQMLVNGKYARVIGNVCMDMTMIDISGIDAREGDSVIVIGEHPSVTELAAWAGTIAYEMLTGVSQRVKRVYFNE